MWHLKKLLWYPAIRIETLCAVRTYIFPHEPADKAKADDLGLPRPVILVQFFVMTRFECFSHWGGTWIWPLHPPLWLRPASRSCDLLLWNLKCVEHWKLNPKLLSTESVMRSLHSLKKQCLSELFQQSQQCCQVAPGTKPENSRWQHVRVWSLTNYLIPTLWVSRACYAMANLSSYAILGKRPNSRTAIEETLVSFVSLDLI